MFRGRVGGVTKYLSCSLNRGLLNKFSSIIVKDRYAGSPLVLQRLESKE